MATLLITVGMGTNADPQSTLYHPLERSMRQADAGTIWLLPSSESRRHAEHLQSALPDLPIQVAPMLPPDSEEDPDKCFHFFEAWIRQLIESGVHPSGIVLDYTRGTKTMSAAALMAALSNGVDRFAYVSGVRGPGNLVQAGTEKIREFSAAYIAAHRELQLAERLMKLQRYSAIASVIHDCGSRYPELLRVKAQNLVSCANFWDAWDRLDYVAAADHLASAEQTSEWYSPSPEASNVIRFLARARPSKVADRHEPTWALVFDVLENARRRLAHGQYEDALIRIYRGLELIGQAELYRYGIETDGADPSMPVIQEWISHRKKGGKSIPEAKRGKGYELSRSLVGSLLKFLKSPIASKLNRFDDNRDFQAGFRNQSLLIHGFSIRANQQTIAALCAMLEFDLPAIARVGVPANLRWVESAVRFPS